MKLIVLVPSEDYKSFAGARIRYNRVIPELATHGILTELVAIGSFDPTIGFDALLISKCHDAQSLIAAMTASTRGKLVGVDLFDDYFSNVTDSRLVRYRSWLKQLAETCDFALCSTPVMGSVVGAQRPDLPTHVMNDPAPSIDRVSLSSLLEGKLRQYRKEGIVRLAWFGVGDNPHFRVGLSDLASYGSALAELGKSGVAVELTVLTNRRALTAEGIALITHLPVEVNICEWSEQTERDVLCSSLAAFLPVNAGKFSTAKSLNRAFTALSSGCQILSVGYPLYEALEPLIYRDAGSFLGDLREGRLRLSNETIEKYFDLVEAVGSPRTESLKLTEFLRGLTRPQPGNTLPIALIHGHATREDAHRLVQAVGGFSVASPYCSADFDFDVLFRGIGSDLEMLVSRRASRRLLPHIRGQLGATEQVGSDAYYRLEPEGLRSAATGDPPWHAEPVPFQIATYKQTAHLIRARVDETFGPCRPILSETSRLPFPPVDWAA